MTSSIFRTKPIIPRESHLKRCLSAFDLSFLGIGAIIGTGIFVLTGIAAANQAGPAVVLSFVFSGLACAFAALAYAELAASVGGCGSAYGYSYAAFGEIVAWMVGWILLLEYSVSVAAVANGWSGYLNSALSAMGVGLPTEMTRSFLAGGVINLPASLIILLLMVMLVLGVKQCAQLNSAMVFIKLLVIVIFITVAARHVDTRNWHPFMPFGWFDTLPDGHTIGVLAGASLVFFAYVGFDAVSTAVEEARDPQRDVPIGIIASLGFCTVVYIVVSGLLTGIVPYQVLNVPSPVAYALTMTGHDWASAAVAAGVIAGLTTVMLVLYYGLTRVIFAMSRDGLLPSVLSGVNQKTQTPVLAIVVTGVAMSLGAGEVPLGKLAELVNIGTLCAFVMVCAGVVVLRVRQPDLPRPFKSHLLWPVLGFLSCGALMLSLPRDTWLYFLGWQLIGLLVYFGYSRNQVRST